MGICLSSESEVGPYTHGSSTARGNSNTEGMIRIPGGTFRMGSDKHYPEEAPIRRVTVSEFWIDPHPVTNRQFKEFVSATRHVTFGEIPPDPKDYPGARPHKRFASVRTELLPPLSPRRAHAQPVDTSTSHVGFRCVIRERKS